MRLRIGLLFSVGLLLFCVGSQRTLAAQAAAKSSLDRTAGQAMTIPPAAQPSATFNVGGATDAYLALIPPASRSRSDAYFEGGYWLLLWDFLYGAAVALLLLNLRRLEDPATTQPILRLARANGIPVRDVYQVDASRQTTRMSAALESGEPRPLSRGTSSQLVRAG